MNGGDSNSTDGPSKAGTQAERSGNGAIFRARRRPRKTRKREDLGESGDPVENVEPGDASTERCTELSREELLLLREAQQLRERVRASTQRPKRNNGCKDGASDSVRREGAAAIDEGPAGLSTQFSAERGGLAIQERMDKYIQNGLREKFGHFHDDEEAVKEKLAVEDTQVFEIPEQLQVEEGPLYDPSDGMPSAGLEEVQLPVEDDLKALPKASKLPKRAGVMQKAHRRDPNEALTPGNLSSNFLYHRQKWKEANVSTVNAENRNSAHGGSSECREGGRDGRDDSAINKQFSGKRSRFKTDIAFAERWKKRLRR